MQSVRRAIEHLNPQEAYVVSDRCVELLLQDGRRVRVTAQQEMKSGSRYWADHEIAYAMEHNGEDVTVWGSTDLPWADGDSVEDCLAHAILLMAGP